MASILAFILVPMALWLGITLLGAGLFTTYFGAGKSRTIGLLLFAFGLAIVGAVAYLQLGGVLSEEWTIPLLDHFLSVLGVAIGGILAVAIFLFAIMKS